LICEYGCGQEANHQFKNGKWCCSKNYNSCLVARKKISTRMKKLHKDPNSKFNSKIYKDNQKNIMKKLHEDPDSSLNSILCREKQRKTQKFTIEKINKRYPFFSKIEEMRYDPDKPGEKEIQVHCKNHNCENSKEKGGWFTPTYIQLYERIRQLEHINSYGGSYFYCSQHCKDICPLYNLKRDPCKDNKLPYTYQENQIWRQQVLELDKDLCQFCGKPATDVHHIKPVKNHPHLALDPDNGISFCEDCHYKIGHQGECSTGNLAKIVCSTESQKFLNQKNIKKKGNEK